MDDDHVDAREGLAPSCRGLQSRACLSRPPGDGCQGGDRTPAFRVTAGRLTARLPGIALRVATGNRTPISELRARRLDQWTIATRAEAGRLERPRVLRPVPVFETGSSSSRVTSLSASPARFERATSALGTQCSGSAELRRVVGASTAGVEPASLRFRRPVPIPFGHVDLVLQCAPWVSNPVSPG